MNEFLEAALAYAEAGFPVFPLVPKTKNPIVAKGLKEATTNFDQIRRWWSKWPDANIGIPMGKASGLIGIDIDYTEKCPRDFLQKLPPHTTLQNSPSGGHHAFFKIPETGIKNIKKLCDGATVRAEGSYFVMAPSHFVGSKKVVGQADIQINGRYTWVNGGITGGSIEETPEWVINCEEKKKRLEKTFSRHDSLKNKIVALRHQGANEEGLLEQARQLNESFKQGLTEGGKPDSEIVSLVKWVMQNVVPDENCDIIYTPFPDVSEKKKPLGTIENVKELLRRLDITVRYNVISKEEEILIPESSFTVDNKQNSSLANLISWCERCRIPTSNLSSYLTAISDTNLYNPVITWIESEPWDGNSRLQDIYDTIDSKTGMKNLLIRKWMLSAIAALYEPDGVSAHGVLVLKGAQYLGKTAWFKKLAPSELNVLQDGAILRPDDKDSVYNILSKWIVELGELDATFRKSDIAQLKAFITKKHDCLRRPYAKKESNYARRTILFGSVNEHCFLSDPTGNRRFWVIDCDRIDFNHCVNMQQLWAEVRELYRLGESWYLTKEEHEQLNVSNESFEQLDPIEERIRTEFRWTASEKDTYWSYKTATEICEIIGYKNPSNFDAKKCGAALRKMPQCKLKVIEGLTRFFVPYHEKPIGRL